MDKYTASNGVGVRIDSPYLDIKDGVSWRGIAGSRELIALREFFAQERDEELGRWRWPENPDYVVYLDGKGSRRSVTIFKESTGGIVIGIGEQFLLTVADDGSEYRSAARAYFDAHPERKPWHDAKPGEVWVIEATGDGTDTDTGGRAWVLNSGAFMFQDESFVFAHDIADARRIWPESD